MLTEVALLAILLALAWNTLYNASIVFLAMDRSYVAKLGDVRSSITILVAAKNEPIEVLEATTKNVVDALQRSGVVGELLLVLDDDPKYVAQLLSRTPRDPRIVVVLRLNGVGRKCGALNLGYALARYENLLLLDADARIDPRTLDRLARCRDVCIAPWRSYGVYGTWIEETTRFLTDLGSWLYYLLRPRLGLYPYTLGSGTIVRKEVLEEVGGWRLDVVHDDIWLGSELAKRGYVPTIVDGWCYVSTPSTLRAARIQLERWSFGALEIATRFGKNILSAPLNALTKFEAYLYLLQAVQSLIAFLGFATCFPAVLFEPSRNLFEPPFLAMMGIAVALAVLNYIALKRFANSFEEPLYRKKLPFLMGRASALSATLMPFLAINALMGLLGKRISFRITPKRYERGLDVSIPISASMYLALAILAILFGNQPIALVALCYLAAPIYVALRIR